MMRWSCIWMASAPALHRAFSTAWMSCWCTTRSSGRRRGESAVRVALGVGEGHHQPRPVHRIQPGVGAQLGGAGLHRGQRGSRGRSMGGVDLARQRIALTTEPVHRSLGVVHQVDQAGGIAAPDLTAAGDPMGGGEQQPGQQADHRDPDPPRGSPGTRGRGCFRCCLLVATLR